MDDPPTAARPKGFRSLPLEEKLKLCERIEAGENQSAIGREYGVSRQAVFIFAKGIRDALKAGRDPSVRGRAKHPFLTETELQQLRDVVTKQSPNEAGIKGEYPGWTTKAARRMVHKLFGHGCNGEQLYHALREWGVFHSGYIPQENELSPEYYAYINSDIGKEVLRKEQEWWAQEQARFAREGPKQKKLGRPRKESLTAATAGDDADDRIPTIEEMEKELQALRTTMGARKVSEVEARYRPPAPGQRTGKHALNQRGPRVQPKKRR